MAPSGGSTSLGTQAHDVHDYLTITQEDILNWTPQRLRRQCFQFGLVSEAPEGDVATLRTVFLRHWRAAFTAAYEAATQEPTGDGAAGGNASEDLPRAQGGQCVTPPASTQGPAYPVRPVSRSRSVLSRAQNETLLRSPRTWTPSPSLPWTRWTHWRKDWFSLPGTTPTHHPTEGPQRPRPHQQMAQARTMIDDRAAHHRAPPWPAISLATDSAAHRGLRVR